MIARTFSTREASRLLGISEATLKRHADAGEISSFRERNGRRFEPAELARHLTREASPDLDAAVRAGDASGCVGHAILLYAGGCALEEILDRDLAGPLLRETLRAGAVPEWSIGLLDRLQVLGEPAARAGRERIALALPIGGAPAEIRARIACCALRANGFWVLFPRLSTSPDELARLVVRSEAAAIALWTEAAADLLNAFLQPLLSAAKKVRGRLVLGGAAGVAALPDGVVRVGSFRQLVQHCGA